jgi:hypothetical protein
MSIYQRFHDEAEQRVNGSLILNRVIDKLIAEEKKKINKVVGQEKSLDTPTTYSSALERYVALKLVAHRLNRRFTSYDSCHLNWKDDSDFEYEVAVAIDATKEARKAAKTELENY